MPKCRTPPPATTSLLPPALPLLVSLLSCAVLSTLSEQLGMAVFTYDAHSHGRSGPEERALVRNCHNLVDDLLDFVQHVRGVGGLGVV